MTKIRLSTDPKQPIVSVLICSYNAERFIEATIRSVAGQTYRNLEILVLDNDSSDGTKEILGGLAGKEPRLKVYAGKKNLGAYGGLNYLLERATGQYIAINDHDDIWHPDKIDGQVKFLEKNARYAGCGTGIVNYYERYNTYLLRRQPQESCLAWHTSLVFRNSGLRYNARARVANDFLFMKHVLCRGKKVIYNLKEPYVLRCIRGDRSNLSTRWINPGNLKEILFSRIGVIDRLALLNRLVMPEKIADFLVLKVLLRRNVRPPEEVRAYFGLAGTPAGQNESPNILP